MTRRRTKKAKSVPINPSEKPKEEAQNPAPRENEQNMDFGGLPDRDLKKNLGCG